jgi:hypothetical protein
VTIAFLPNPRIGLGGLNIPHPGSICNESKTAAALSTNNKSASRGFSLGRDRGQFLSGAASHTSTFLASDLLRHLSFPYYRDARHRSHAAFASPAFSDFHRRRLAVENGLLPARPSYRPFSTIGFLWLHTRCGRPSRLAEERSCQEPYWQAPCCGCRGNPSE